MAIEFAFFAYAHVWELRGGGMPSVFQLASLENLGKAGGE
jgi:hypothetical protein